MRTDIRHTPSQYFILMRFHKPIGMLLLLWPTLWGLWVAAKGFPNLLVFSVFVLGVVLMRAAGCVINDIADRHFDGQVARTQSRPLVTRSISLRSAALLFLSLILIAFGLVCLLNVATIALSFIAALLAILYPFTKRWTHWPQFILGLAFSWGIPMAFAAQTNQIPPIAWLLFITSVLWAITYDTEYAMTDREDDAKIGIKSTAILFGANDRWIIGLIQIILIALLLMIGRYLGLHYWYYLGVTVAAGFSIYQQRLIRNRDPKSCFRAFLNNNWFGFAIFAGIFLSYLR